MDSFLAQSFIYLLAAVIAVPVAKRLGMGSVLGYLMAGAVIGPYVLRLVRTGEGGDVMHYAEFGVVMMMFVIGLELRPRLLWQLRGPILGMGGMQVLLTAALIAGVAMALGQDWRVAVAVGLILAMSSTAIVLQTLAEKGQLSTHAGRASFATLLFQDIAVIPILAVLPLLAAQGGADLIVTQSGHGSAAPAWQRPLLILGAVGLIVGGGRFLIRPVFRFITSANLREVFTATALALVIGIALMMEKVGLSPALGTFLAGVMLSDSEYRHELESDLEPFKGLLLGVFFISVGATLDFALIAREPLMIAGLVAGLILVKMVALMILARSARMPAQDAFLYTVALAQGGEFCFVLLSLAQDTHVLDAGLTKRLSAAVALSMALTPFLWMIYEKLLVPRLPQPGAKQDMDEIAETETHNPVIIAGFGRYGLTVGRLLRVCGVGVTVLDLDSEQIDFLRKLGYKVFYGDASRLDMLTSAGAAKAKLLVLAIDNPEKTLEIVETVQRHFPGLKMLVRAHDRTQVYELLKRGVKHIVPEAIGTSCLIGQEALIELGVEEATAVRRAERFMNLDRINMRNMFEVWNQHEFNSVYVSEARRQLAEMERLFQADDQERS